MPECIDCGHWTGGQRCKSCRGKALARLEAELRAADDSALLKEVGVALDQKPLRFTGISSARLAVRWNVSRERVYQRVRAAQRRQRILRGDAMPINRLAR